MFEAFDQFKKETKSDANNDQDAYFLLPVSKLKTSQKIGSNATKIAPGTELGGQEIKNNNAEISEILEP